MGSAFCIAEVFCILHIQNFSKHKIQMARVRTKSRECGMIEN